MYADRVLSAASKRSVKERLNGDFDDTFSHGSQPNPKRQRQDDEKWKHDLYEDSEHPHVSSSNVGVKDLRLKLQRKSSRSAPVTGRVSQTGDLREKLSGVVQPIPPSTDIPKSKPVSDAKVVKSTPASETAEENAANPSAVKKTKQKSGSSVAAFLKQLGLEKYLITFQAEEIDMTALVHMTDEDLKALGIPMGPRKKILLALDSRVPS